MSAYASGLFPPISSAPRSLSKRRPETTSLDTSSRGCFSLDSSVLTSMSQSPQSTLDLQYFTPYGEKSTPHTFCIEREALSSDATVTVREAKIDSVKLIKAVTGTSRRQQLSSRKTLKRKGSRERPSDSSGSSHRNSEELKNKVNCIQYEDAVEFELSISFNGRKYSATRTLESINQFRWDLMDELDNPKRFMYQRRPSSVRSNVRGANLGPLHLSDEDGHSSIPEVPPLIDESSHGSTNVGFWVRDFTMLQAVAFSYIPVLDQWLRDTISAIPQDSESLANFLWEPLGDGVFSDSGIGSCPSSSGALSSIQELGTDDESDTDLEL